MELDSGVEGDEKAVFVISCAKSAFDKGGIVSAEKKLPPDFFEVVRGDGIHGTC